MKFNELVGKTVGFCGVDNNAFCVVTPDGQRLAFEAIEDESDGYRSMLDEVREVSLEGLIFFRVPIADVTIKDLDNETVPEHYGVFSGYAFDDADDHRWLLIGTSNNDDYYPSFTVDYSPPRGVCIKHDDCRGEAEMARACAAPPDQGEAKR